MADREREEEGCPGQDDVWGAKSVPLSSIDQQSRRAAKLSKVVVVCTNVKPVMIRRESGQSNVFYRHLVHTDPKPSTLYMSNKSKRMIPSNGVPTEHLLNLGRCDCRRRRGRMKWSTNR